MKCAIRLLSLSLCFCLLLSLLPLLPINAATYSDLTYTISDGQVTITDCNTSATGSLIIPNIIDGYPVTGIGISAFENCYNLTTVTIPDGVTSIGDKAFFGCNINTVTIPASVASIGDKVFGDYYDMFGVHFPTGAPTIWVDENNSFYSSDSYGVLFDKYKAMLIQAPGGLAGDYIVPDSVTYIEDKAFFCCRNLVTVIIPDSVTSIGTDVFDWCNSLSSVTIGSGVTSIGTSAFVTSTTPLVGKTYLHNVPAIFVDENNQCYSSDCFGVLFDKCKKILMRIPDSLSGAYIIPDSVISIEEGAFAGANTVNYVTIPDGITMIGDGAFYGCNSIQQVSFAGNAPEFGNGVFSDVVATVCYPSDNNTWKAMEGKDFGGYLTWYPHSYQYTSNGNTDCVTDGTKSGYCERCGLFSTVVETAYGHSYESVITAPDCVSSGFTTHICTVCGDRYTDASTAALGHSFTQYRYNGDATCTGAGTKTAKCDRCEVTETVIDIDSATGHDYESTITTAPTCINTGVCTHTCTACDDSYAEVVEPIGHSYEPTTIVPTCLTDGYTAYTCTVCGNFYTDNPTDALGHSFTNYQFNNNSTCTLDGTETAKCGRCDVTDTRVATGTAAHTFINYVSDNNATCYREGTKTAQCQYCSATDTVTDPGTSGHRFNTYIPNGNATCYADGTKTATCDRCPETHTVVDPGSKGHRYQNGQCIHCAATEPPKATLAGQITSFGGNSPVTVELYLPGELYPAYSLTATDGTYRFGDIFALSYTLKMSKENHVTRSYALTLQSGDNRQDGKICLLGDVTGDGRVNVGDTALIYGHARKTALITDDYTLACADATGDTIINIGDAARVYAHAKRTKLLW